MVALLSLSSTKSNRRRKADAPVRSLPATLLTNRISELHRRLIDPAADIETVKDAKRGLLRLLSDPLTLPVITTPPMEMPVLRSVSANREQNANRVCEVCDRPLPRPHSGMRASHHKTLPQLLAPLHSLS